MKSFIAAIDQGTTGTTVLIFDRHLNIVGRGYQEITQFYPQPGWVEHDLDNIWQSVTLAFSQALQQSQCHPSMLAAIGLTNQRETLACFDKHGKPLYRAIVWQDRRTSNLCQILTQQGHHNEVQQKTGLLIDPYFSATKMLWLMENLPHLATRLAKKEALWGTIDTYLIYKLTGHITFVTDPSNASRTMLYDLHKQQWSQSLCDIFHIPIESLPKIIPSQGMCGETSLLEGLLPAGIPIAGIAGDQQAALFGQLCWQAGEAKCTYGTGSFILMNTGHQFKASRHRLLSTMACHVSHNESASPHFALEGSTFVSGALIQWLRDGLGIIRTANEIETLANSVKDSQGVVIVPALTGLGAPHWLPHAQGLISGISRGTTRAHIARAALEAIALQNVDIFHAMQLDADIPIRILKVDGGAAQNDLLMQIQADLLGIDIIRPQNLESTATGAAMLAGLAVNFWQSPLEIQQTWKIDRRFSPNASNQWRQQLLERWQHALSFYRQDQKLFTNHTSPC